MQQYLEDLLLPELCALWQASGGNPPMQRIIETELKNRILHNKNFTREYFFDLTIRSNHAANVSFIPTSDAYHRYGEYVTLEMYVEEEERIEMLEKASSKERQLTYGPVKANALVKDGLSPQQVDLLKSEGFHTRDVLEVLHV